MLRRTIAAAAVSLAMMAAWPVMAAQPEAVSPAAQPVQFYVFSFNATPAAEAAEDLVGSALGYRLEVDPAVEGEVSFTANGWYSGDALLNDFGAALLDQDIALMRTGAGAYALIPRSNVPIFLGRGGVLMTLPEPAATAAPAVAGTPAPPPAVYGRDRWQDGAVGALLLFLGGAAAGAAALLAGQTAYRRAETQARLPPPPLRLTDQRTSRSVAKSTADADPDLVIPHFDERD